MWTILFDIDGTLLRTRGAGLSAIQKTMRQMFKVEEIPPIAVHGRTDNGILRDVFEAHQIEFEPHLSEFLERYANELAISIGNYEGHLLPGVKRLLTLMQRREDVAVGLLTGNCERAAKIKLEYFGIHDFFDPFGGFGDTSAWRNDVAKLAYASAERYLQNDFSSNKVWVVGDTIDDVICGQSIGARVLAVETGGCSRAELLSAVPDICFSDLTDGERIMEQLCGA